MVGKRLNSGTKGIAPKILLISEDRDSAAVYALNLGRTNLEVALQEGFEKAVEAWEHEIPDMVLIDTRVFGPPVLDLIRKLREMTASPILVLTPPLQEDKVVETYLSGIDECIIKPVGLTLINAKIYAWLRRTRTVTVNALEEIRVSNFLLKLSERNLTRELEPPIKLTNLELRLLHLLMSHSPHTVGYDEILHRVWGSSSDADNGALKNVVYRLRMKIEADPNQPEVLLTLPGVGYKFVPKHD